MSGDSESFKKEDEPAYGTAERHRQQVNEQEREQEIEAARGFQRPRDPLRNSPLGWLTNAVAERQQQAEANKLVGELAPRVGLSASNVVVVSGEDGKAKAAAHGAPAVTIANQIYLGGSVDLTTDQGRRIVAHELIHVVQQTRPSVGQGAKGGHDSSAFEREAHQLGAVIIAGETATPKLRTSASVAQGYDSPEHHELGDNVHSVLDPVLAGTKKGEAPEFGGVSASEAAAQKENEKHSQGASHSPELGTVADATKGSGRVAVPQLEAMLRRDESFKALQDGARGLTISARNYQLRKDAAGPYLAMEIDPATKAPVRYDVPVSAGDMTALNGDLYGSVENMRKAPADEIVAMRNLVEREARWEADIATGKRDPKDEPSFDSLYEQATAWRHLPVYAAGVDLGPQGQAAGGDSRSYLDLALHNQAHFGQPTDTKQTLEIKVRENRGPALARGKQGNLADGSEQAWMNGHARARQLAKESYDLKNAKKGSAERERAETDRYGHETDVPETGVLNPSKIRVDAPKDARIDNADGRVGTSATLKRSSNAITPESKLNDAYVENAGADHYLTDAFAAGHQIVRNLIGDLTEQFVHDKGGRQKFLDFIITKIQDAAVADKGHAKGALGDFQDASKAGGYKKRAARGDSMYINDYGGVQGLKQQLAPRIDNDGLRAIGAKLVHDYYNRHGLIVHNAKGMTFLLKGDGHLNETPEARKIIALAVLESRNQITELAMSGSAANPMDVWDYTPSEDRSKFTADSGKRILAMQFSDGEYLWNLLKDDFSSVPDAPAPSDSKKVSAQSGAENAIHREGGQRELAHGLGDEVDVGQPPVRQWFRHRREYLQAQLNKSEKNTEGGPQYTDDRVPFRAPPNTR